MVIHKNKMDSLECTESMYKSILSLVVIDFEALEVGLETFRRDRAVVVKESQQLCLHLVQQNG